METFTFALLAELASALKISSTRIRLLSLRAGSLVATVEISDAPTDAQAHMQQMVDSADVATYPMLSQLSAVTAVRTHSPGFSSTGAFEHSGETGIIAAAPRVAGGAVLALLVAISALLQL